MVCQHTKQGTVAWKDHHDFSARPDIVLKMHSAFGLRKHVWSSAWHAGELLVLCPQPNMTRADLDRLELLLEEHSQQHSPALLLGRLQHFAQQLIKIMAYMERHKTPTASRRTQVVKTTLVS